MLQRDYYDEVWNLREQAFKLAHAASILQNVEFGLTAKKVQMGADSVGFEYSLTYEGETFTATDEDLSAALLEIADKYYSRFSQEGGE